MIQIYNRKTKSYEEEQVVGKKYLEWIYDSLIGKNLTEIFFKKKLFSKLYGLYCDTKPVSYTHLDVYKRQLLWSNRC